MIWIAGVIGLAIGAASAALILFCRLDRWYVGDLWVQHSEDETAPYVFLEVLKGRSAQIYKGKYALMRIKRVTEEKGNGQIG